MSATPETSADLELAQAVFDRIAADLGMILDRTLVVQEVRAERATARAAGEGCIHISFRFGADAGGMHHQGCVLVPLPDAISMASYLMMMPDEEVAANRERTELDVSLKEALLEVGNFIAGACDAVIRRSLPEGSCLRAEGCQGVRPDVRPALEYEEGEELVVARASLRLHEFPSFSMIVQVPSVLVDGV